jgi:fluoride exporter
MNQLMVIALGGAFGAIMRFFVSSGVYHWLGRGFPYGTLTVNVMGSFLIGLLTEALVLQRIAIAMEYRAAILVGFMGSFTTFSTFSLETLYLLEQGNLVKALLNITISIVTCIFAVWIGLLSGRTLFMYSGGVVRWLGWVFPYAIVMVNVLIAFLIGMFTAILVHKGTLSLEHKAAVMVILVGIFTTLSSLYLILYLIEEGYSFESNLNLMLGVFMGNAMVCLIGVWAGLFTGKLI